MKNLVRFFAALTLLFSSQFIAQADPSGPYPNTGDQSVCLNATEPYGVEPTSGSTYTWYVDDALTSPGGDWTITGNGNSSITVTWSKAGVYTLKVVEENSNGCVGDPVSIQVTVNALPDAPSAGDVTVCYDGSVHTGSATAGVGESIVWYDSATNGSVTTAPSGTSAGTYTAYAAAKNTTTNCESATRTLVTVQINALPDAPSAGDVTVCYDGSVHTGSATAGVGESIVWYDSATNGSVTTAPSGTSAGTYTAYAAAKNTTTNCESATRTLVTVQINALPDAPSAGDVTVCYDGSVHTGSATAGVGESIVWYDSATNGSVTTAPSGTSAGTYTAYAAAKNTTTNCESATRTLVTVQINALPDAPSAGDVTVCYDGSVHTGSATAGVGESIVWYDSATNGSVTTAPSGTSAGTYTAYAAAKNTTTNCESATRTLVTVQINALPDAPSAGDVTVCYDGSVHTGSATAGVGESIVWYDSATNGSVTTAPSGTSAGTYTAYAAAKNTTTNCESATRTLVTVQINALPDAPSAGDVTVCYDGSVHTGSATAGVGESIVWYDSATNGSVTTAPSGTSAGTYTAYAAAKNTTTNCESATRTLVTVQINALPDAPSAGDVTVCYDGSVHTGSATAGVGESIVWYDSATNGSVTTAPSGTSAGTYTAYAAAKNTTTNCESATRTLVTVQINALPDAPSAGDVTVCYDGSVHTGSATAGVGESIVWYDSATNGSVTTAPSGTSAGTYTAYAAAKNTTTNCESATRTLVTVQINALPDAPSAGDVTVCYDGSVHTGSATAGVGESIVWYDSATNGSVTTAPSGTSAGTYTAYAAAKNTTTNCESATRTLVTVQINALPDAPSAGDVTVCYDGSVHTGSATAGVGESIVWYDSATNGSVTTAPSGTSAGTYTAYAAAKNTTTNCESATRTLVTVQINALPDAIISGNNANVCSGGDAEFTLNGTPNSIVTYSWDGGITTSTTTLDGAGTATLSVTTGVSSSQTLTLVSVENTTTSCTKSLTATSSVTVSPAPVVDNIVTGNVCSGDATGVILPTTSDNSLTVDKWDVIANVPIGLTANRALDGTYTTSDAIQGDIFTNTTNSSINVVYTVTPYTGSCAGASFTITVTIYAPIVTSPIYHN
jgi:hypothetical protein